MDEKKRLNKSATVKILSAIGAGIFMRILAASLLDQSQPSLVIAGGLLLIQVGVIVLFCLGCADYAKSKGYSATMGLFGLLGCIGLVVLALLRDKWKPAAGPVTSDTNYTRDPNRW